MRFRAQNLTDGKLPTWRHGRAWLGKWRFEWTCLYRPRLAIGIEAGGYDDDRIMFKVHLLVFGLYVSREFKRCFADRELSLSWHDGNLWIKLWCDDDWHRDRPWHRNTIALHVVQWFTGSPKCVTTVGQPVPCLIPMPEGCYPAMAKPESRTWTWRFGYTKTRESYSLDIPGGIPFQGKGENSWDCDDDGLWGIGGDTLESAIGNAVERVLEYRHRRGETAETQGRVVYARAAESPKAGHKINCPLVDDAYRAGFKAVSESPDDRESN